MAALQEATLLQPRKSDSKHVITCSVLYPQLCNKIVGKTSEAYQAAMVANGTSNFGYQRTKAKWSQNYRAGTDPRLLFNE